MRQCVTFLSDFGVKDAYVAQVKGVIISQVPDVLIIDITHDIDPFDLISAGWLLSTSYPYFPPGTVHLAVVDPGVGTDRAVLCVRKAGHVFVGPDNGLFSFLYPADDIIEVSWRPMVAVSSTFHGRDIFASLVVKIITGHGLNVPGSHKDDPVCLDVKKPMVVHIDGFGNIITNISCARLGNGTSVEINGIKVGAVSGTFADIPHGSLGLICGSAGTIEIAANMARAADIVNARSGMMVSIVPELS
jgi:S-adenosyl-L-methionine hydrolase (adenosine-forming)